MASTALNITPWPLAHTLSPSRGAARTSGAGEALGSVQSQGGPFLPCAGLGVVSLNTALCGSFSAVPSR